MQPKTISAIIALSLGVALILFHFIFYAKKFNKPKVSDSLTTKVENDKKKIGFFELIKQYWILFIGVALLIPGITLFF